MEWLTNEVEGEAMKCIRQVDDLGGYVSAIEKGYIHVEISAAAMRYQKDLEAGARVLVGVNRYATDAPAGVCTFEYNPRVREVAIERIRALRQRRDGGRVRECLGSIKASTANGDELVLPRLIEAARADATVGEMMGALREVFGSFDSQPILSRSGC